MKYAQGLAKEFNIPSKDLVLIYCAIFPKFDASSVHYNFNHEILLGRIIIGVHWIIAPSIEYRYEASQEPSWAGSRSWV